MIVDVVAEARLRKTFKKLGLKPNDAELYLNWCHGGQFYLKSTEATLYLKMFERLAKALPAQVVVSPPATLYRGLLLSRDVRKKLLAGSLSLRPRVMSSWTANKAEAQAYARGAGSHEIGVVLKTATPRDKVVLFIGKSVRDYLTIKHANSNEVVLRGAGLVKIRPENITNFA